MSLASADLRGYMKRLQQTHDNYVGRVNATYRKLVQAVFVDIVEHTPQFSGQLAYGWEIVTNRHPATSPRLMSDSARDAFVRQVFNDTQEPYQRGDDPVVSMVLDRELDKLKDIRYNTIVKIVNNVKYAESVDGGEGPEGNPIRPENLYYGKVFMTSYAAIKYGRMRNLVRVTE